MGFLQAEMKNILLNWQGNKAEKQLLRHTYIVEELTIFKCGTTQLSCI